MDDPYNGKYCKDCKHWRASDDVIRGQCLALTETWHPVWGPQPPDAVEARTNVASIVWCGPEGKLWEPKEDAKFETAGKQ